MAEIEIEEDVLEETKGKRNTDKLIFRSASWKSSTKLDRLLKYLSDWRKQDENFKAVVFSQFTSFLNFIEACVFQTQLARAFADNIFRL
jgi:SNF2 family DNA or RNA helicase